MAPRCPRASRPTGTRLDEDEDEREVPSIAVVPPQRAARGGGGSAAARLLATQMAVSGSSREEIETRLRNGFEIEDTE